MLATSSPSAGVYTVENDLSKRTTALSTSIAAIVGYSERGPVMQRTLTVDDTDFKLKFGDQDPNVDGFMHYCALGFLTQGNRLYTTRVVNGAKTGGLMVYTKDNFCTIRSLDTGFEWDRIEPAFSDVDIMLVYAENPGTWNNTIRIALIPDVNDPTGDAFTLNVYEGDSDIPVETYRCTTFKKMENKKQLFIEEVTKRSPRIRVKLNRNHIALKSNRKADVVNAIAGGQMVGGSNGESIKQSHIIAGWDLYDDWEQVEVNILINGGYSTVPVQLHMDTIAQKREDCIAVLDVPPDYQEGNLPVEYRRDVLALNSSFSALYTSDIFMADSTNQIDLYLPPSGHVAAQYAYTDRVKACWYAPAGETRGKIKGALGTAQEYKLGHRNALTESQVNCIRTISNVGTCIFDEQTLQAYASSTQAVHNRRLLCMLRSSIRLANLTGVFRPNTSLLRDEQKQSAEDLLKPVLRGQGLYWYSVVCDERNNPPESIQNGDVIVDIYLQLTEAAKRIHLNAVVAKTGQIKFAEEQLYGAGE